MTTPATTFEIYVRGATFGVREVDPHGRTVTRREPFGSASAAEDFARAMAGERWRRTGERIEVVEARSVAEHAEMNRPVFEGHTWGRS